MEKKVSVTKEDAAKKAVEHIVNVVKTTPLRKGASGTVADNAKFGTVNKHGVLSYHQYPCHAHLRYDDNRDAIVVYSTWGKRPEGDIDYTALREFFNWIRSDDGPWRAFEGRNVSHVPEDWKGTVEEFIWDYGWVWSDVDKYPSNLQHSFLTASRMAPEWPKLINKWHEWVGQGCDKALAFMFLDLFRPTNDEFDTWGETESNLPKPNTKVWQLNRSNRYDWPLDVCTATEEYVRNYISGKVEALNKPFAESNMYRPVNRIFGKNELNCMDPAVYPSVLFQLYASKYGPGPEKCKEILKKQSSISTTEFQYERHWFVSESEVISIIKEEGKRLYGTKDTEGNSDVSEAKDISFGMRNRARDEKGRLLKVG